MSDPMDALRARFVSRLGDDREALAGEDPERQAASAHRLAGAAGVFGFDDLGRLALRIDDQWRAERRIEADALAALLAELDRVVTHG